MITPETTVQIDISTIFAIFGAIIAVLALGPIAFLLKGALVEQKEMKEAHSNFKDEVNREFVRKSDHINALNEIKGMLNKIFDRLDDKADK